MSLIEIHKLPEEINIHDSISQVYNRYLLDILEGIESGQSVLVECDKVLVNFLIIALKGMNKGRAKPFEFKIVHHCEGCDGPVVNTVRSFANGVREIAENNVLIVPNFDIIICSDQSGMHLDLMTRDILICLYENPDLVMVGFKDPFLNLPKTISNFFTRKVVIFGIDREFLPCLITQAEARRIDTVSFDPYQLYKYVSGLNVIKFREIMEGLTTNSYTDGSGDEILNEIRRITSGDTEAELPNLPLDRIGGYEHVKKMLREEILGLLKFIQQKVRESDIRVIKSWELLIPKNILFTGPAGTGKTMFCKALATELNAAIFIVNGPELKSKWVGESERAIRNIFSRARKCAPSLIVFDEIDSFAKQRGSGNESGPIDTGTFSDNSMLNQLLTEMDGFRVEEMVFVIATTNLESSLDNALLSRFRCKCEVPYPEAEDRRAIMEVYNEFYSLDLEDDVISAIVSETALWIDQNKWMRFAGRDLEAIASTLARNRLLASYHGKKAMSDIRIDSEQALKEVRKRLRTKPSKITFRDIGGYQYVKDKLNEEIITVLDSVRKLPVSERKRHEQLIPKGIIFEGAPGTGKTMFAQALSNSLGATISVVRGPELKGSLVGETEERIRHIFNEARKNAPSVIVFDEIDSIAGSRENQHGASWERSMVNQLLTEMDGISERGLVFVIATTNFAKSLDKALKRPGRFEFVFHIPYPDDDERRDIFSIYNKKYELGLTDDNIEHLIYRTDGWVDPDAGIKFSGDHIEAICRSIARKKLADATWTASKAGLDMIIFPKTEKLPDISPEEEAVIAVHEAGHAIVAINHGHCRKFKKISISSEYEDSLGYHLHEEFTNKYIHNRQVILAEICCLLAGRVAEKKVFGELATGGSDDIEKATYIATYLVANFGMDESIGSRRVMHPLIHGNYFVRYTSPELLSRVEQGVEKIINEQENLALQIIENNWDEYNELKERLLHDKVIEFDSYIKKK